MKYRHEYKYYCDDFQLSIIQNRLQKLLSLDKNIESNNSYLIRSLYFDDYNNTCLTENEDGTNPREKFRIRSYNLNDTIINLELKQKSNGMTQKLSTSIDKNIFNDIISNNFVYKNGYPSLLKKLYLKSKIYLMKPVIIVEYERIPYVYKDGNVRITIDKNICSSSKINAFFDNNLLLLTVKIKTNVENYLKFVENSSSFFLLWE